MPNGQTEANWTMKREPLPICGIWEDQTRRFMVSLDRKTIKFLWSRVRDTDTFTTRRIVWNPSTRKLGFELHFPPDDGNPDGVAFWTLEESGKVTITFKADGALRGRKSELQMQRLPIGDDWLEELRG